MADPNTPPPAPTGSDDQPPHVVTPPAATTPETSGQSIGANVQSMQENNVAPFTPKETPSAPPPAASAQGDGDPGDESDEVEVAAGPPCIDSIAPTSGPAGTTVTIRGKKFGRKRGVVTFNSLEAQVMSWSPEEIVCRAPDLPLERGGHNLVVEMDVQVKANGWARSVTRFRQG